MKPFEGGRFVIDELPSAADGRERPAGVAFVVLEEPFERVADVAGGQRSPVVKADPGPQAESVPQAFVLRGDVRDEPGNHDGAFRLARQRLEDVRERLSLLDRAVDGGVERPDDPRDRHVDDSSAGTVVGSRSCR